MASTARSPRASRAARARKVESTPPEKATTTRSISRSSSTSRAYFPCDLVVHDVYPSIAPASSARGVAGRAPTCEMTSAAASDPSRPQTARSRPRLRPTRNPGGVEIAGAGRVDQRLDGMRIDHVHLLARHDDRAALAARERGHLAAPAHLLQRGVEVPRLVQRADLGLVGEQDVHVVLDQVEERVAVPVDAERIGQRERDLASRRVRQPGRRAEGLLSIRRIEEIALEVDDLRARDQARVDVPRREMHRSAEERVHRPLRVGRDQDEAPPGFRDRLVAGRRVVADAGRAQVVREHIGRARRP